MATKKKAFRSRKEKSDDDDDDKDETLTIIRPNSTKKKGEKKADKSSSSKKNVAAKSSFTPAISSSTKKSMLSFDDEEEDGGGGAAILKTKKKKTFSKKPLRRAMEELDAEDEKGFGGMMATAGGYGTSAGEYTVEKLASLKKGQHFQVSTKPSKSSSEKTKVTFVQPDGIEGAAGGEEGEEDQQAGIYDDHEVQRLKEKREKNRREAMGDFIPLTRRDEDGHEITHEKKNGINLDQASSLTHDQDVENDWESEMIRRGARKAEASSTSSNGDYLFSSTAQQRMASSLHCQRAQVAFKSVESVLKDLHNTKARVDEAHEWNVRAAEKAKSELELVKQGLGKMRHEFDDTAERFQFMQDIREYISSLCGCLREKEGMIKELGHAIAQIRQEATERRFSRRIQDQEDELQEIKEKGMLQSMQKYSPILRSLLEETQGPPAEPQLDEFGRDKTFADAGAKDRRRRERVGRREKALKRAAGPSSTSGNKGVDTAEAEARLTGAEDSETDVDVSKIRTSKLFEAAEVIFEDVAEEYGSIEPVAHRFEMWKKVYPKDYQTAYVSIGLPQIFDPFVRIEMVRWEPIKTMLREGDSSHEAIEGFAWYNRLFTYGQQEEGEGHQPPMAAEEDPDDRLVPTMVERVAIPLLEESLKISYDPFSSMETSRAIAAIQSVLIYEPSKHVIDKLMQAPLDRLKRAVRMLCVPLLRLTADAEAVAFQRRQSFKAVKLFNNLGQWGEVLSAKALAPLALGDLLEKALAPALGNRLANSSDRKTMIEILSTLEALVAASPPMWVLEKIVSLQAVFALLDKLSKASSESAAAGGGPVLMTVNRLKAAFGGSPTQPR